MNGSPNSRQRATPVASSRLSPRARLRSSHLSIRLNGRTPSSSEPCRRAGRWSCQTSSRCLKRGMLLSSTIADTEISHGKRGFGNHSSVLDRKSLQDLLRASGKFVSTTAASICERRQAPLQNEHENFVVVARDL